jgi:hypothetical protein
LRFNNTFLDKLLLIKTIKDPNKDYNEEDEDIDPARFELGESIPISTSTPLEEGTLRITENEPKRKGQGKKQTKKGKKFNNDGYSNFKENIIGYCSACRIHLTKQDKDRL